jgi:tetratricopeptide (TPR) repeat protein
VAAFPVLFLLTALSAGATEIPAIRVAVVPFAEVGEQTAASAGAVVRELTANGPVAGGSYQVTERVQVDKVAAGAGAVVTELIANELVNGGRYEVIERAQLESVLGEMRWQHDKRVDDATAATAGRQLGAAIIVAGSVMKLGRGYTIAARFVEVETSRAVLAVSRTVSGIEAIPGAVPGMVDEFLRKEDDQAAKLADEGQRLIRQGRRETGRERLGRLVSRYPRAKAVPDALHALARMDMAEFHYSQASERLNDLLDTFPLRVGNSPAMYDLAECYYLSVFPPPESAETVLRDLDRVMERFRNPEDPLAATGARVALCRKARELYRAVLAEDPGTPQKSKIESRLRSLGEILGD